MKLYFEYKKKLNESNYENDSRVRVGEHVHPDTDKIISKLLSIPHTTKLWIDYRPDNGYKIPENHLTILVSTDNDFGDNRKDWDKWSVERRAWKDKVKSRLRSIGWKVVKDSSQDNDSYLYLVLRKDN